MFSINPILDTVENPTARIRGFELVRALCERQISATLFSPQSPSDLLIWGNRDTRTDVGQLRKFHCKILFDVTDNLFDYHGPSRRL